MRGEEAVEIVRHFVDDAMVVGVSDLRILHGKGNGILKSMIREYLNSLNVVKSCRDERCRTRRRRNYPCKTGFLIMTPNGTLCLYAQGPPTG